MKQTDVKTSRSDSTGDQTGRSEDGASRRSREASTVESGKPPLLAESSPHRRPEERRAAARKLAPAQYVFYAALAAFAVLAILARLYAYFSWDVRATLALQSLPLPGLLSFMRAVSIFGDSWHGWALTALAMLVFFLRHRRTEMFGLLLSVGGGELVNRIIKWVVGRPRPAAPLVRVSGYWASEGFPSGHVAFYVCFFGFLFFVAYGVLHRGTAARRAALVLAALPVLLIGFSRMYLGAHWASDVLGAYLLSGVWLALTLHFYRKWKARSTFHRDELRDDETAGA